DWDERLQEAGATLLELYRDLIRLRRTEPGFTEPSFRTAGCDFDEAELWFRMDRPGVSLLINFVDAPVTVPAPGAEAVLLALTQPSISDAGVRLGGKGFAVVRTAS